MRYQSLLGTEGNWTSALQNSGRLRWNETPFRSVAELTFPVHSPLRCGSPAHPRAETVTRDWYLLCVTVQEKTRVLHDDQAPGFLHALQEAAKWGSVLPNEVTQLAEPTCDFLQQLDSGHSAQIFCTKMITTWTPRAFLRWPPFWKHSLCWNIDLWNPSHYHKCHRNRNL